MGNFKRFTIVFGVMIGMFWHALRRDRIAGSREMFNGFRQLGGVYVKFLQILSIKRSNIFDVSRREALAVFDAVEPDDIDVHSELQKQLGERMQQFSHIESQPFAAGSFGQVYYARHIDGSDLIIKVLRPDLVRHIKLDLKVLRVMAWVLRLTVTTVATDMNSLFKDFRQVILNEINYEAEANNAEYFYEYFANNPHIFIPKTYRDLSTNSVIVQQFVPGLAMTELLHAKENGADVTEYVREKTGSDLNVQMAALGEELLVSILAADRILGDPHPGNIKLLPGNVVGIYDFGITGDPPEDVRAFEQIVRDYINIHYQAFNAGDVFIHGLRFFASDMYRAINTVATLYGDDDFDLFTELRALVDKTFAANADRIDVQKFIRSGRISQIMQVTVNEGNRFALRVDFDSSVMIRAADGYITMVDALDMRQALIPAIFEWGLARVANDPEIEMTSKPETMDIDRAVDIVSNWLQDMFEGDPVNSRAFIRKVRGRMSNKNRAQQPTQASHPAQAPQANQGKDQ